MVEIAILWSPGLVPLLANHASSVFQDLTKWPGNNGGVVKFTKRNEGGEWERVAQRRISLVERNVSRCYLECAYLRMEEFGAPKFRLRIIFSLPLSRSFAGRNPEVEDFLSAVSAVKGQEAPSFAIIFNRIFLFWSSQVAPE